MEFIHALEKASLEDSASKLGPEALRRLRNPPTCPADIASQDLRLGLDLFLSTINSSQQTYTSARKAILRRHPDDDIPSYDQMKRRIVEITGVESIEHDMCIKSCLAYTGPFSELDKCLECDEPRHDPITKKARQTFHTMLLGPQLQALWRHKESADEMLYRRKVTAMIMELLEANGGILPTYDDYFYGSDYIEAVRDGRIQDADMVLMLSLDGAQLYRYKQSDCWIYIWVIMDLAPGIRYKKKYVLIGGIIPGPNKPKIVDSYLFPGLHHVSALQKEGLPIWNASHNVVEVSRLFFALGAADGPGMTYLNGLVGHHGKNGCRIYCSATGRHKPGLSHYYPAFYKPHNYNVEGCSHDDYSYENPPLRSPELYEENLRYLMASPNERQYKKRRLETGICKPSIFLGLDPRHKVAVPSCFGSDIMHLESLNIPDLLIPLWRGTFDCDKTDSRSTWPWAILCGDVWEAHGRDVAAATPYLPGSFDRPPRNPAEKISSGYKAWEFLLYLYGLGPGVFYNVLPQIYYKHFCKLVFAVRIINQHQIKTEDLKEAHQALVEFAHEFELLYYQRRTDRLHFVRQSIHALTHLALEVIRLGPLICSSQWTMERTIGNLGEEIRSHVHPYANLSQRGLERCQVNALKAMFPDLEEPENLVPRGAKDLGNGFVLLRAREVTARHITDAECQALRLYLRDTYGIDTPANWSPKISRWARLRLPNGQVARSAWKEKLRPLKKVRMARNVMVRFLSVPLIYHSNFHIQVRKPETNHDIFAEVQYYFRLQLEDNAEVTLAMVSCFSSPDKTLLDVSHNTLRSCTFLDQGGLAVIDVKYINSVIAMVPHQPFDGDSVQRYFVVEKPGLEIACLGGVEEQVPENE
jgi:hypothetical protein